MHRDTVGALSGLGNQARHKSFVGGPAGDRVFGAAGMLDAYFSVAS